MNLIGHFFSGWFTGTSSPEGLGIDLSRDGLNCLLRPLFGVLHVSQAIISFDNT